MIEFISASLYQPIYLLIVAIITFICYGYYHPRDGRLQYKDKTGMFTIILVVCTSIIIGLRPNSGKYFVDMGNYVSYYVDIYEGLPFTFNWDSDNIVFDNLFVWWASERLGIHKFFLLIATIYFGGAYLGIRKLFPNDKLVAYLVFLAAFSTFSYATNGIKAGAAASLFLCAMGYRKNLIICIPLVLISWGFHHSMILPVAAFGLTLIIRNCSIYFLGWFVCLILAATNIQEFSLYFARFITEHGAEYLTTTEVSEGLKVGLRVDFIIYSSVPVLVGIYTLFIKEIKVSSLYKQLLNLYLCTNGVWMLCMYANYTNRIAYLSWFLYPIVLVYPFLQEQWGKERYRVFGRVMLLHLCFTLFMYFVYYA